MTQLQTMSRSERQTTRKNPVSGVPYASLKTKDISVLKHLDKLIRAGGGDTCTVGIRKIASACGISERQVQISTNRLIKAGLLKREGYDFSNPNRTKRGTIYKIVSNDGDIAQKMNKASKKKVIRFLLFWSEG